MSNYCIAQSGYYYKTINTSNGLTSNTIYYIYYAKNGILYIAHSKGLSSFDGIQLQHYPTKKFPFSEFTHIMETADGDILCEGFNNSLYQLDHNQVVFRRQCLGKYGFKVSTTIGNFNYAFSNDSLCIYHTTTQLTKTIPIQFVKQLPKQIVHYGIVYDSLVAVNASGEAYILKNNPYYLHDRNLFIVENNGITWFNKRHKPFQLAPKELINHILLANDKIYVCTTTGLYEEDEKGFCKIITGHSITDLVYINHEYFIASTLSEGLFFYPNKRSKQFMLPGQEFTSVTCNQNKIYIGTAAGEILNLTRNKIESIKKSATAKIKNSYWISGHEIIIGNDLIIDGEKYKISIKDIDFTSGSILLATNIGILQFKYGTTPEWLDQFFVPLPNLPPLRILKNAQEHTSSIEIDHSHQKIFISNYTGLFELDNMGKLKPMVEPNCVLSDFIYYDNRLLLLTKDRGIINLMDKKYIPSYPQIQMSPTVYRAKASHDGLWCRCENEIVKIKQNIATTYLQKNGLNSHEVSNFDISDSLLCLISNNKLITIPYHHDISDSLEIHFGVKEILANNNNIKKDAILDAHENIISISFYLSNFYQLENLQLAYTINGADTQHVAYNQRIITLNYLEPQDYNIEIFIHYNDTYKLADTIHFTILKPIYQRGWFLFLCGGILAGGIIVFYKKRLKEIKQANASKEAQIQLERELDQSMLTSIRTQMNPHFLYNALNTIQSYVYMNDVENAGMYISKFSELTRNILKHSEKKTINIIEEINSLNLYLTLEKMRFEDVLHYEIYCDPLINKELTEIPPLLIQPYVENAIKHGLFHKLENRKLKVEFLQTETGIRVIIDDNGIGRKKSEEMNAARKLHHTSFSMDANKKRIDILKQYYPSIQLNIIDKVDAQQQALGTTFIIDLPHQL